jgi:hypothetical protein
MFEDSRVSFRSVFQEFAKGKKAEKREKKDPEEFAWCSN